MTTIVKLYKFGKNGNKFTVNASLMKAAEIFYGAQPCNDYAIPYSTVAKIIKAEIEARPDLHDMLREEFAPLLLNMERTDNITFTNGVRLCA